MTANDGVVYCIVRSNGDLTSATKYGRLLRTTDDGDTWETALQGSSSVIYDYAVFADENTVIVNRSVPDSGTSKPEVIQRTDAYNIVIVSEDDASITSYGEYCRTIINQQVQTRSVGERIGNGLVSLYSKPLETFDVQQKIDTSVELAKTYMVWVGVRFPLRFPISWQFHLPLPENPMNVSSITYHYPQNRMGLKLGRELDDINSTLSDLLNRYIEEHQGDEMAVATQDGTNEKPGYARTPTGKVCSPHAWG